MKIKEFAIYDKNDELLFVGNAKECTDYLELKNVNIFYDRNKYCKEKNPKCRKQLIVEIEDDEGEEDGTL